MLSGKEPRGAAGFIIDDKIDLALAPELHILGAVAGNLLEAHRFKNRFDLALFRRTEFDEFKAIKADRVFKQVSHGFTCNFFGANEQAEDAVINMSRPHASRQNVRRLRRKVLETMAQL